MRAQVLRTAPRSPLLPAQEDTGRFLYLQNAVWGGTAQSPSSPQGSPPTAHGGRSRSHPSPVCSPCKEGSRERSLTHDTGRSGSTFKFVLGCSKGQMTEMGSRTCLSHPAHYWPSRGLCHPAVQGGGPPRADTGVLPCLFLTSADDAMLLQGPRGLLELLRGLRTPHTVGSGPSVGHFSGKRQVPFCLVAWGRETRPCHLCMSLSSPGRGR